MGPLLLRPAGSKHADGIGTAQADDPEGCIVNGPMHEDTFLAHGVIDPQEYGGVVNPPVYHASTITFRDMDDIEARGAAMARGDQDVMWYGRKGTPSSHALQNAIAQLEGGDRS